MTYPTYPEMVKFLFKPMATPAEELLHAAIGLSGEVGELADATTRANLIEEMGDLCFYLQALDQQLGERPIDVGWQFQQTPYGHLLTELTIVAARILDAAKKAWAYGKPHPLGDLKLESDNFGNLLGQLCALLGTTLTEVRHLNQTKLMKRYPSGYTNEAAIARADKA